MGQTVRQQARKRVGEAVAARKRAWAEREARLSEAAVDVVAAIVARDQAEQAAADAIAIMLALQVSLTEVGERCGLALREVTRLKRSYLDTDQSQRRADDIAGTAVAPGGERGRSS